MLCFRCTSDSPGGGPDRGAPPPRAPVAVPGEARCAGPPPPAGRACPWDGPRALLSRSVRPRGCNRRRRYHAISPVSGADRHEERPARELSRSHARGRGAGHPPVEDPYIRVHGSALRLLHGPGGHGQLARLASVFSAMDRRRHLDAPNRHLRAARRGCGEQPWIICVAAARAIPGARGAGHHGRRSGPDPGWPSGLPGSLPSGGDRTSSARGPRTPRAWSPRASRAAGHSPDTSWRS